MDNVPFSLLDERSCRDCLRIPDVPEDGRRDLSLRLAGGTSVAADEQLRDALSVASS